VKPPSKRSHSAFWTKKIIAFLALMISISACSGFRNSSPINLQSSSLPNTEVTFRVKVPENTPENQLVQFTLLDEVTGLNLNQKHFSMRQTDPFEYEVVLQAPVGSVIK
jgi:hypothetical protein